MNFINKENKDSSAIYEGWISHHRHFPKPNAFKYKVAMMYLDLSEIPQLFQHAWLWSDKSKNVARFNRNDFLSPEIPSLDEAVREKVVSLGGERPQGPVRLLAHLRYFGIIFNPVTFYYCFSANGIDVEYILAEITNTPWKEKHCYLLNSKDATKENNKIVWRFQKTFHVSPFMGMDKLYEWKFSEPEEYLRVHMGVFDNLSIEGPNREFDAYLNLKRIPLNKRNLRKVLWRYPAMTLKIILAIHWQALKLYVKGNPVHTHPRKINK